MKSVFQTRLQISRLKKKECQTMDESQAVNKIEASLPQEKIDFVNHTHAKEVEYWKKVALDNKNQDERRRLTDLAPLRIFQVKKTNSHLKQYLIL